MVPDNGLRKKFPFNLALFYSSFGRKIQENQKLFNMYYTYPDAKKVLAAFTIQLESIKKNNDY